MKKILLCCCMVFPLLSFTAHALDWGIAFVVYKGDMYEVHDQVVLETKDIGKRLGQVTTKPNEVTGKFHSNASNVYPIGTPYHEIKGVDKKEAIAILHNYKWKKATYSGSAPSHFLNFFLHPFVFFTMILGIIGGMTYMFHKFSSQNHARL